MEGVWTISDTTDNNSGEREVWAMRVHAEDRDYISIYLQCSGDLPTLTIDWDGMPLPDQAVFSVAPIADSDAASIPIDFVLKKESQSLAFRGYAGSPTKSAEIVKLIGDADDVTITAHTIDGARSALIEVRGLRQAWSRVARHCPVSILPVPPV